MSFTFKENLSFTSLTVEVLPIGEDLHIAIYGGGKPHIGCVILSLPRPSLKNENTISSTSSVINVLGHKDDELCKRIAEAVCQKTNRVVSCSGGVHIDHISKEQIQELLQAAERISDKIIERLKP